MPVEIIFFFFNIVAVWHSPQSKGGKTAKRSLNGNLLAISIYIHITINVQCTHIHLYICV